MNFLTIANSLEEQYTQFYYYYIFPADLIVRLFENRRDRYNRKLDVINREVAIRLVQRTYGKTVFSRYYSPPSPKVFKNLMVENIPTDVFIGAGYTYSPRQFKDNRGNYRPMPGNRKQIKPPITRPPFHAIHHEFVLDLDLTDYDRLRTCCQQRAICKRCWRFMAVACELLDMVLRIDLGVRHRLWLYSGGRGLHCWCFDKHMLTMDKAKRTAIIDYMLGILLPKNPVVQVLQRQLNSHPSVLRAYKIALKHVSGILQEQNCFSTQYGQQFLLDYIDIHLRGNQEEENLRVKILELIDSENEQHKSVNNISTNQFLSEQSSSRTSSTTAESPNVSLRIIDLLVEHATNSANVQIALKRIVLNLTYPRIDAPVSQDMAHLLRCPFSVHTSAGARLVLPIRPENVAHLLTDPNGILRLYPDGGVRYSAMERLGEQLGATNGRFYECKRILEELCEALEEEGVDAQGEVIPRQESKEDEAFDVIVIDNDEPPLEIL